MCASLQPGSSVSVGQVQEGRSGRRGKKRGHRGRDEDARLEADARCQDRARRVAVHAAPLPQLSILCKQTGGGVRAEKEVRCTKYAGVGCDRWRF